MRVEGVDGVRCQRAARDSMPVSGNQKLEDVRPSEVAHAAWQGSRDPRCALRELGRGAQCAREMCGRAAFEGNLSDPAGLLNRAQQLLIQKADENLYRAKSSGRNRVCSLSENSCQMRIAFPEYPAMLRSQFVTMG